MTDTPPPEVSRPSIALYGLLAAAGLVFITAFSLLSPILLSLLLILLISLAINPVVSRLRAWTGEEASRRDWSPSSCWPSSD